jgi:hypothetical protein
MGAVALTISVPAEAFRAGQDGGKTMLAQQIQQAHIALEDEHPPADNINRCESGGDTAPTEMLTWVQPSHACYGD